MRRRKRKQKTPEQMRKRANRRQRFFHTVGRLLFVGILLSAAVLALTVFFKVDTISVEGSTKYTPEEIVAGMDVKKGDNLYLWNKVKTTNSLLEQFPYLETVQIRRHLPDALVVTVTECRAAVAVSTNGVYYLVSAQGKVLEQAATDNGLPVVAGVTLEAVRPGQTLEPAEDAYVDALLTVLQTLDAADMLSETDFINLQSLTDVPVSYTHLDVYKRQALAALGIALQLDMPLADAAKALATATGVKGRVEVVPTDTDYTVLIDYAHSPDGVENVLRAVRGFAKGRVVALFGCGGDRDRTKRPKMGAIAAALSDFCIVTSDNPRTEEPQAIIDDILEGMKDTKTPTRVIVDRPEAIRWALAHARKEDIIVLMGKGHETYQEVNHVKHHMDEREIVADYFADRK